MKDEIKFYLSKERLLEIGKYINRQLIIHRNVEHDSNWTTEEKMIVQLYDFVVALLDYIPNLQQKLEYYENIDPDKTIDKFRQKINREMFNLQEENKELKHKLEQMYNDTKDTYNEICAEQIDYKSRNEKAIHYCKLNKEFTPRLEDVENILNGDDNE